MKNMFLTLTLTIILLVSGANESFASSSTYKVKKGDTLYKISQMHNTTVAKLKSLNNLKSDMIFPNQKLSVVSIAKKSKKTAATSKKPASKTISRSTSTNGVKEFTVSATAYTAYCNGCTGITKTGINLRENSELKVIAVDPNVIKLGTKVHVEGYGYAIAGDTGGSIKGNKIDVFIPTKSDAYKWGRKNVKITIMD
ncbi:LysM peptidoglycan-binding domain-containing protein [Sporosarcina sp. ANT_H38]|uniref:3D domain-containing protein n=1 Tax=Sporosarcina sp. ANT_H38 TaxID=2597358 RepID=UPI0011F14DF2|nr:3D domain-containing protein [Sporosarcina sp. ANT_H38]KAA0965080.1 LysM peptidoglycan-binding domain-containing protein [Sporosarcina sp. ANT_H38]